MDEQDEVNRETTIERVQEIMSFMMSRMSFYQGYHAVLWVLANVLVKMEWDERKTGGFVNRDTLFRISTDLVRAHMNELDEVLDELEQSEKDKEIQHG